MAQGDATMDVLNQYFDALRNQDWESFAETLAEDIHRTGPYLDEVRGRQAYADYLAGVISTLENYELVVKRRREIEDGDILVELSEFLEVDGVRREYPEALLFGFDATGRIRRVDIFIKQPPHNL